MKLTACLALCVFLCACAGNPPAWWNPSGAYGGRDISAPSVSKPTPSPSGAVTAEEEEPFASEILLDPADENVEELRLSPLSGEITEEPVIQPAAAADEQTLLASEESASAPESSSVGEPEPEELLPEDGSLPPPSVLR